jgi:hypothetical protein
VVVVVAPVELFVSAALEASGEGVVVAGFSAPAEHPIIPAAIKAATENFRSELFIICLLKLWLEVVMCAGIEKPLNAPRKRSAAHRRLSPEGSGLRSEFLKAVTL